MENACRKDATRRVLADAGVPGPRFAVREEWADLARAARDIGYPLVVKPVDLCAGMYVRRVDDEAATRRRLPGAGRLPGQRPRTAARRPSSCSKNSSTVPR